MSPRTKIQNEEIRQQSKQNIMMAALELFAHNGYHNTSVSQIAKEAGVSKGLMYNYFSGKEDLLETIVFNAVEEGEKMLNHLLESTLTPKETLEKIIHNSFEMINSNLHFWKLMASLAFQSSVVDRLKEPLKKRHEVSFKKVAVLFKKLGSEKPEMDAFLLGAIMDGVFMHYITLGENYPLKEMKSYILNKFIQP